MSRPHRLLATAALLAIAVPAVAPAAEWNFLDNFSPLGWIRALWSEEGSTIDPWGAPRAETGSAIDPWGAPRQIWGEEGSTITPWGQPAAVPNDEGSGIDPWGRP